MIPAAVPLALATSPIVSSIITLYSVVTNINDWVNKHIQSMQESDNITVSRTGKVLEGAKLGFGLGYAAPIIAIATGQMLLGNTFAAATTVATAATMSNPIAMTCASIGAIYYGWNALNDAERNNILEKLSQGLEIGIELIKSIIQFIARGISTIASSAPITELKKLISNAAELFQRTLYDVTQDKNDKPSFWSRINKYGKTQVNIYSIMLKEQGFLTTLKNLAFAIYAKLFKRQGGQK